MRRRLNSLRARISALSVALVLMTTLVIQISSWWNAHQFNNRQIAERTASAERILIEYLKAKDRLLLTSARVLTADFGFKQAVASRDQATIDSALSNHSERINADLMLITDLDGQLIVDHGMEITDSLSLSGITADLIQRPSSAHLILLENRIFEAMLLPVRAPRTIAYAMIGFEIDQNSLDELTSLTGLDVSFLHQQKPLLTTLQLNVGERNFIKTLQQANLPWLFLDRPAYRNSEVQIQTTAGSPLRILLTYRLAPIYQEYDKLALRIILVALLVMLISVAIASTLARTMTVPLNRLSALSRQFARGDYSGKVSAGSASNEIEELGQALQTMGGEIQKREQIVTYQAQHDMLTGLFNIHRIRQLLPDHLHDFGRSVLVACYIENFRRINDRLGPEVADRSLVALADRLSQFRNTHSKLHGRLDGVEFLSVYKLEEGHDPDELVSQLMTSLERPFRIGEITVKLSFHIGVALYPDDGNEANTLLRRACIAADHARNQKTSTHRYTRGEDETHLQQLALIEALNGVIQKQGDGQLYLNFQPKVSLGNRRIDTVETLIRWQRPDGDRVSPELFIGLAEQAGLIVDLTHWVIDTTLQQLQDWNRQGHQLHAAINVSAQDISHPEFCSFMQECTIRHAIKPEQITIELTERDIMVDEALGLAALQKLKDQNFRISVDDYGIGQSSLAKLKQLPVDELKLDKSFIMRLDESPDDQKIVRSTIQLAHSLGLSVVAEGVENLASCEILEAMGCDSVQGYYISRPLDPDNLIDWLESTDETTILPAASGSNP